MLNNWFIDSWKNKTALQQPEWPNIKSLDIIIKKLRSLPALVFSGETRKLKEQLKLVNKGKGFVLQVGSCSESFTDCNGPLIHNFLRVLLQMSMVLNYQTKKEIIKIGRIAGQYAKPRSLNNEIINGVSLPAYRGDIINDYKPDVKSRTPNPKRLLEAYFRSAATLNLIRAFIQGGYTEIKNLHDWKKHFYSNEISNLEYYKNFERELTKSISESDLQKSLKAQTDEIYISHEALLLDYEQAFTRIDTTTGDYYCTSAHTVWIGDRTKQLNGAHVEFLRGVGNPIGIKVGPNSDKMELVNIIKELNPTNEEGKIMIIIRIGKDKIDTLLSSIIRIIKESNLEVIWCCDPMHGNTFNHDSYKVRGFDDIVSEMRSFFKICNNEGVIPGGIHLEITGEYVSECIGGINGLKLENIYENYVSKVDPRLNAAQALEISFLASELINKTIKQKK